MKRKEFSRFTQMGLDEKREYVARLQSYTSGKESIIRTLRVDDECRLLITALSDERAHQVIRDNEAGRKVALELFLKCVMYVKNFMGNIKPMEKSSIVTKERIVNKEVRHETARQPEHVAVAIKSETPPPSPGTVHTESQKATIDKTNHLSDYKHLLSEKLQLQSEKLPELFAEMNDLHENRRMFVMQILSLKKERKDIKKYRNAVMAMSKRERNIDCTIAAFWRRVDYELDVMNGKIIPEEYKRQLDKEEQQYPIYTENKERKASSYTKKEIEELAKQGVNKLTIGGEEYNLKELADARMNRNIKYLRKKELGKSDAIRMNMMNAAKELVEWGYLLTPVMQEHMKERGLEVPVSWCRHEVTDEERLEKHRAAAREGMRKVRDKRNPFRKIIHEIKEEEKESPYKD